MSTIVHTAVRIKTTTCCICHVLVGMSEDMYNQRLEDHQTWHCPNGHAQHFTGKSEAQKLREENERLENRVAQERSWRRSAEGRTERERRSHAATRGHLTRAKNKAAHGCCPYCTRTFKNVQRHIDNMHPDEAAADKGSTAT